MIFNKGSEELTKYLAQISIVHFNRWLLSVLELDLSDRLPRERSKRKERAKSRVCVFAGYSNKSNPYYRISIDCEK